MPARIISISGASASGKTTVARELLSSLHGSLMLLSVTTRLRRPSDVPGEYQYVSQEEFDKLDRDDSFLWSVGAHGNRYGTLRSSVEAACAGSTSIAILTIPAAEKLAAFLTERFPGVSFSPIYLRTGDITLLEKRLRGRGDSEDDIRIRIEECKTWNELAAHSFVPFQTIDASSPLPAMVEETKKVLGLHS